MPDELDKFVNKLQKAHGENLRSILLYGPALAEENSRRWRPKNILVVLEHIAPDDLRSAHSAARYWRSKGNHLPVYFTRQEIAEASDVFPIEFLDISRLRRVVHGEDPFEGLEISTRNFRHQLEYELRGKLLRLRSLYIPASGSPDRLARLMAESLDSFIVLFRHALAALGADAPIDKRACVLKLSDVIGLDKAVFDRIFEYEANEEVWVELETNRTFAAYLKQVERVVDAVNHLPAG